MAAPQTGTALMTAPGADEPPSELNSPLGSLEEGRSSSVDSPAPEKEGVGKDPSTRDQGFTCQSWHVLLASMIGGLAVMGLVVGLSVGLNSHPSSISSQAWAKVLGLPGPLSSARPPSRPKRHSPPRQGRSPDPDYTPEPYTSPELSPSPPPPDSDLECSSSSLCEPESTSSPPPPSPPPPPDCSDVCDCAKGILQSAKDALQSNELLCTTEELKTSSFGADCSGLNSATTTASGTESAALNSAQNCFSFTDQQCEESDCYGLSSLKSSMSSSVRSCESDCQRAGCSC